MSSNPFDVDGVDTQEVAPSAVQPQQNNINPFDEQEGQQPVAQTQQTTQPQEQPSTGNTFLDGVAALGMSLKRTSGGIEQQALAFKAQLPQFNLGEFAGKPIEQRQEELAKEQQINEQELAAAKKRSPWVAGGAELLGDVATGVALGGVTGIGKTVLGKAAAAASGGAIQSGLEYAQSDKERLTRAVLGGAVSGVVGGILNLPFKAIKKRIQGALTSSEGVSKFRDKMFDPKKAAAEDLAYNIETTVGRNLDEVKKVTQRNKDLNADTSPGELIGGDILRTAEGKNLPTTPQTRKIDKFLSKHDGAALENLQKTVDDMTPMGYKAAKKEAHNLYEEVKKIEVDPIITGDLLQNDVIRKTLLKIDKGDISDLQGLRNSNLHRLDGVKRRLDKDIYDAKGNIKPEYGDVLGPKREARELLMKKLAPYNKYTEARNVSQRVIVRGEYMKALAKKDTKPGQRGIHSVDEVYDALFSGDKKAKFLNDVQKTGGDIAHANRVVDLFDQIRNSPIRSLIQKPEGSTADVIAKGRIEGMIQDAINKFGTKEYHNAVLNLNLSGSKNWIKVVEKVYKEQDKNKRVLGFLEILQQAMDKASKTKVGKELGKVIPKTIGVSVSEPDTRQGYIQ